MSVTEDRDQRIEDLFADALEVPETDREVWLSTACGADRELLAEIRSLLRAYAMAPGLLDPALLPGWSAPPAGDIEPMAGRTLGPWRIVRLIAAGGMGAVYLGERTDDSFRKQVAIKVLAAGSFHPALLSRFRLERQLLADLDHPGIARLLDGGTTSDGTPYLVMEHVDGVPLGEASRDRHLSIEDRLRLFLEVADAVQYAHTNLVIHRDLKPANIVLRRDGRPKLLDFGIAKVFEPAGSGDGAETVVGTSWALTPRYASPEQIRGEKVTTATDIYSLGVVLYELLTGRLPYDTVKGSLVETGRIICETPPTPPSRIPGFAEGRRFAGDLDTILLKALAKEPRRRYASVADFAEDVRRHLDGEPVVARGESARYRLGRFARRNRGLVLGLSAFILTLIAALVVALSSYREARESAATARWYAYTSTLAATESAIMNHNIAEARELLASVGPEYRGWEYRHLATRLDRSLSSWKAHDGGITNLWFSRDGRRILTTGVDGCARVWQRDSMDSLAVWKFEVPVESGQFLAGDDAVALGLGNGRVVAATIGGGVDTLGGSVSYALIDVHPDGNRVAAGFENGDIALFDAAARREVRRWRAHFRLSVPAFSPDGRLLATGGADSLVKVWNLESGELLATLRGHRQRVFHLAFSGDSRRLVSGSRDRTATVWDLESGLPLSTFSEHRGTVSPLIFHPDGSRILSSGSEGRLIAWDPATGGRTGEYHGHQADVSAIDMAPAGDLVATGEWDGTIRFWKWGTDDVRVLPLAATEDVLQLTSLNLDPSGSVLASVTGVTYREGRLLLIRSIQGGHTERANIDGIVQAAFADTGALVIATDTGRIEMFDGEVVRGGTLVKHNGGLRSLAVSPVSRLVAAGGEDGWLTLRSYPGLDSLAAWKAHSGAIFEIAFDRAGRIVASAGEDGRIRTWNAVTGDSFDTLAGPFRVRDLVFHPEQKLVAFAGTEGVVCTWRPGEGSVVDTLMVPGSGGASVAFSPDGTRLAVGRQDALIYVFDVKRGSPILRLHGHLSRVSALAFTPDGNTLFSAGYDGTVRVWDAKPVPVP